MAPTIKGMVTNGPIPTISIILMAVACGKDSPLSSLGAGCRFDCNRLNYAAKYKNRHIILFLLFYRHITFSIKFVLLLSVNIKSPYFCSLSSRYATRCHSVDVTEYGEAMDYKRFN